MKKNGFGGKGTWEGDGSDSWMKNGSLDNHDPNYSSSTSSDDDETSNVSSSLSYPPRQFKRIELGQLFEQASTGKVSASSAAQASSPTNAEEKTGKKKNGKKKKKIDPVDGKHAGGAHHTQMPEASKLPLPSSLTNTPRKSRASNSNICISNYPNSPNVKSDNFKNSEAVKMEQSLKQMLNIGNA